MPMKGGRMTMETLKADIVIVGGGVGGCAAALSAAQSGYSVLLSEETDWLGGQLTCQITPADEHGWIEHFGCTASYRFFRELCRSYYRDHYPLIPEAKSDPLVNPGNAWVSPLAIEPAVAAFALNTMLAPHISSGRMKILSEHEVIAVEKASSDQVGKVILREKSSGIHRSVTGAFILDATELGEVLELADVERVTGQESQQDTGEPSAPSTARPENVQAFTWCLAIEHIANADYTYEVPENYEYWRNYHFPITPPWPGPAIGFDGLNPRTMMPVRYRFEPNPEPSERPAQLAPQYRPIERTLWTYRRILDRSQFLPGFLQSDVVIVNWPMNDYLNKSLLSADPEHRNLAREESRRLSLSLLHWLRTEAPRPDGGRGWPGLRACPRITGTIDGLAKAPYIREARRIKAVTTIREQDISPSFFPSDARHARLYEDSIGVGSYRIDLHPSTSGDNFIDIPTLPFQIPLGALIPVRFENLLPAAKNIGTTHITNGCYRLHPIEWNIGEVSGALAAYCLRHKLTPRQVHQQTDIRERFQAFLQERGVEISWPENLSLADGDPHIHARQ